MWVVAVASLPYLLEYRGQNGRRRLIFTSSTSRKSPVAEHAAIRTILGSQEPAPHSTPITRVVGQHALSTAPADPSSGPQS